MYRDGKRTYEFLKLYLLPGNTPLIRKQNSVTLEAAKTIQAQRIIKVQSGEANMLYKRSTVSWEKFCDTYLVEKKMSESRMYTIKGAWAWWYRAVKPKTPVKSTTVEDVRKFLRLMDDGDLKVGSRVTYCKVMTMMCTEAIKRGLMEKNPFTLLEKNEKPSSYRGDTLKYLTADEVRSLVETPCRLPVIKNAFMFSCFTGLRYSDLKQLTWEMFHGDQIELRQKKTREAVYIPLSENAVAWLPKTERKEGRVFGELSTLCINLQYSVLADWAKDAGIRKHITFHVSRHTCATLLLSYGADIYTISKILGHSSVAVTQVYAHVLNEDKVKAVNLVPKF